MKVQGCDLAEMPGCMNVADIKAVVDCELCLLSSSIFNEVLLYTGEWAGVLLSGNLCVFLWGS